MAFKGEQTAADPPRVRPEAGGNDVDGRPVGGAEKMLREAGSGRFQ
jgi:hypothetical protein